MKRRRDGHVAGARQRAEAIRNVVVMLLMSPRFVNHLELDGHADLRARGLPGARCRTRSPRGSRTRSGRRCPTTRCWPPPPTARSAPTPASTRSWIACSPTRARATPSGSSGTSGCASSRSPASPPSAPRSWRWRRARHLGVAGHDHWGDMVREIRDLTDLYTWTQRRGRSRDLMTSDRVGHAVGRSRAPLRRARVERQRRLPALHRRQPRAGSSSARRCWCRSLEQTNPFHRGSFIRRVDPVRPPAAAGSQQPAARLAGSAAAQHGDDHAPALRRARSTATASARPATPRSATSATSWSRTTRSAASARWRRCSTSRPARCWRRCRIDTTAIAAGDRRRHAAGERPGGAESANRSRAARSRPACPRTTSATRCGAIRPRDSADACAYEAMRGSLARRAVALADAFRGIAAEHELPPAARWARHERQDDELQRPRRMFLQGRGRRGARPPVPRVAAAAHARAGQTATPPKRFIVLKSFSTQLIQEWYPRFTGNGYALQGQQVLRLEQGRRHHAADAEAGHRARTTPGRRSPTSRRRPASPASSGPR